MFSFSDLPARTGWPRRMSVGAVRTRRWWWRIEGTRWRRVRMSIRSGRARRRGVRVSIRARRMRVRVTVGAVRRRRTRVTMHDW